MVGPCLYRGCWRSGCKFGCGRCRPRPARPPSHTWRRCAAAQIEGWFDLAGIRAAFEAVDYVGISAYVPQSRVDFQPCDMESLMRKVGALAKKAGSGGAQNVCGAVGWARDGGVESGLAIVVLSGRAHCCPL